MELKVIPKYAASTANAMFQSHLYGIESDYGYEVWAADVCFNRTFMELKGERTSKFSLNICVSIAPLWN